MITFSLWSALIVYYFIMFATPGPNNAMLTASGIKFGYIKTLPHLIGIPLGHFFQITLVSYGLGNIFLKFPSLQFYMRILCFIYPDLNLDLASDNLLFSSGCCFKLTRNQIIRLNFTTRETLMFERTIFLEI